MYTNSSHYWRNQLLWGVLLIAVGIVLFMDHLNILEVDRIWQYWPVILVAFGVNRIIGYTKAKHVLSGLWLIFLGAWLYVSIERVWGLSFHNSWPFLLIAWGLGMILKPVLRHYITSEKITSEKETVYGN